MLLSPVILCMCLFTFYFLFSSYFKHRYSLLYGGVYTFTTFVPSNNNMIIFNVNVIVSNVIFNVYKVQTQCLNEHLIKLC